MKRQNLHPPYYFAYLLRFWQEGEPGGWRVLLEDPHSGERLGFGSMEALMVFLREKTQSAAGIPQPSEREPSGNLQNPAV